MKVPQASIFAQSTKGMSNGTVPMAAPTDAQASEFSGLINQETAESGELADSMGQFMQGQGEGEEPALSPEALSAIAGMIAGAIPNNVNETSLIPTNPEGPTGSLLSPAALGGIPALSYALTMANGDGKTTNTATPAIQGLSLSETDSASVMGTATDTVGKPLVDGFVETSNNKPAKSTLTALKSSVSTDTLKASVGSSAPSVTELASQGQSQILETATPADNGLLRQPHQALQSALDAHLSAQRGRNISTPNWGNGARPQMPRGAMAAQNTESAMTTENILGEVTPQMASQANKALNQAKGQWANGNQISQARLNTAENIADIKSENSEGDIPDLPLAARIIQRSHYAHNMTRPNQSNRVELDPSLMVDGSDNTVSDNPELAITEIYEDTAVEVSEMMTPEGIVRAPTNMQIDVDGDLSVEIEAIGNEVHVTLDGTKSALDEMKGVRAELAESLEDNEMDLGDFSTNTRDGNESDSSKNSKGLNLSGSGDNSSTANSNTANQTIVQHGSSVSAVA